MSDGTPGDDVVDENTPIRALLTAATEYIEVLERQSEHFTRTPTGREVAEKKGAWLAIKSMEILLLENRGN